MHQTNAVHQRKPRAGTDARQALAAELRLQAAALAGMPERLRRAAERNGRIGFDVELHRQARELEMMAGRLASAEARRTIA